MKRSEKLAEMQAQMRARHGKTAREEAKRAELKADAVAQESKALTCGTCGAFMQSRAVNAVA